MSLTFDDITVESLREVGGAKWTRFPGAIGAFVAEMDFGIAPAIRDALVQAVEAGKTGYLPAPLAERMSAACAAWQKSRYGWEVPVERVRPLPDVLTSLRYALDHFTRPDSKVILPTPAYMPFLTIPKAHRREIIEVPMSRDEGGWSLDLDGIDAAFEAGGELLIFCNPHNPIGKVYTREEMDAVAAIVAKHGGRVFSDEIHAPLVYSDAQHVPYASISETAASHTITATSASKAWNLPGLKTAQLILSNDADAERWAEVGTQAEHGPSTLGVIANTAAFESGGGWLDEVLNYLDGNRRLLAELLPEHLPGTVYLPPQGTYLTWIDCAALGLEHPTQFFLENAGVATTDGALCGAGNERSIRFNVAMPRPVLERSLAQMGRAYAQHGPQS